MAWPVAGFALATVILQWWGGHIDLTLPLKTLAVFVVSTALFRLIPWRWLARRSTPRSRFYTLLLFLLFIRHFSMILLEESRRTLQARSLCVTRTYGRGGFSSLRWAVVALFRRTITRAERFYAAQLVNGLAG
jgi:hypothetical protein